LFNGKQEKLHELIYLEIFVYRTPPKFSHSLSVSGRARPWQTATAAQGLKIESQGVEEKENSFNVQIQIFNM
jgi:hypothetical protein